MIDTMVFDALAADELARAAVVAAVRGRELLLLTTPVQEHQIGEIRDAFKRRKLQALPREVVPAALAIEGISRTGRVREARGSGTAPPWAGKHAADALISEAARGRADVLVTDDKRLFEAAASGLRVWRTRDLVAWAQNVSSG